MLLLMMDTVGGAQGVIRRRVTSLLAFICTWAFHSLREVPTAKSILIVIHTLLSTHMLS